MVTPNKKQQECIDKQLGKIDSEVNVYTYHSFCNEIKNHLANIAHLKNFAIWK